MITQPNTHLSVAQEHRQMRTGSYAVVIVLKHNRPTKPEVDAKISQIDKVYNDLNRNLFGNENTEIQSKLEI